MNAYFNQIKEESIRLHSKPRWRTYEEPPTINSNNNRKLFLQPQFYKDVIESAGRFKGQPGFGVRLIRVAASVVFENRYSELLDNASWIPSDSWCYWFLHTQMNFSQRRVTGLGRVAGPMTEKQQRLWDSLLYSLAKNFTEGVRPDMIIGSDEFGQFFFPSHDYIWAERGSKHVECSVWDDRGK